MNTSELIAFALVGSTKAIREEFDLFGVTVVGLTMAFTGGMTRDILVNRVPLPSQSAVQTIAEDVVSSRDADEIYVEIYSPSVASGRGLWLRTLDEWQWTRRRIRQFRLL